MSLQITTATCSSRTPSITAESAKYPQVERSLRLREVATISRVMEGRRRARQYLRLVSQRTEPATFTSRIPPATQSGSSGQLLGRLGSARWWMPQVNERPLSPQEKLL